MMREFIDRLVASLDKSDAEKTWPGEQHLALIKILASIPSEVFSREQRERLMDALSKQRPKMVRSPDQVSLDGWRCIISLATKMMGRPTFYHEMSFSDLVEIASAVSCVSTKSSSSHEIIVELTGRFFRMASATIRQMAEHWDERSIKYFREASKFVSDFKTQKSGQSGAGMAGQALFMTLLKALTMELARSPHLQSHQEMASLTADSKSALGSCIANIVSSFISDKKLLTSSGTAADMSLLAAVDAADTAEDVAAKFDDLKSPTVGKFEKRSRQSMQQGDLRAWKLQIFLRAHLSTTAEIAPLVSYESLETLPPKLRQPLLTELVTATTRHMSSNSEKCQYLRELLDGLRNGCGTDGQVLAVQIVVDQIIDSADHHEKTDGFGLAGAHSELTLLLTRKPRHATRICNILQTMLERRPQAMGQWNIDVTLSTVCRLCSADSDESVVPFTWLCKLVEAVIKKHRLRLEGHYHILLSALQALIRNLVAKQIPASAGDERGQQSKTHAYARLISLICEPTAGAVSRSQRHSALDSATDAAKRSAGRHMYLVMMQFVKLQLEYSVPRAVGEAMEPAVHSIFDITPPEGRKILNDAMDAGGRAILRQMYKRYVQFGKWSGV
ncbi:hypothetical protein CDD83_8430 [Cordyceps sp. RAO-2017]|nr:hypothetical protein CDD83_8430 [Cordyceps sp. RAO-2017]